MADELELSLKVSKEEAEKGLDDVTLKLLELKKQQQAYDTMLKEGSITQHKYAKATAENKVEASKLRQEQTAQIKVVKASSGSMKELASALALNKQAYQNLSAEERKNKDIGGALLKTIQAQDKAHKDLNKSIGQHQPNVGNYAGSMADALKQSGLFGDQLGATGGALGIMSQGLTIATGGLKTLRGALMGTGIGALIVAFGALVAYFTSSEEGANKLKVIMAALGAVVGVITDRAAELGEYLFNAFSNPQESLEKLGQGIQDFLLGRVELIMKGLGGVVETFKHLANLDFDKAWESSIQSTKDLGRGIIPVVWALEGAAEGAKVLGEELVEGAKKAAEKSKEAIALQHRENKLLQDKRAFLKEEAILEAEIAEAKKEGANQDATAAEREAAMTKAMELQDTLFARRVELAKEEYEIKKQRNTLSDSDATALNEEAELEANIIRLEKQRLDQQKEIYGQLTGFQKQQKMEAEKAAADKLKKEEEAAKKALEIQKKKDEAYNEWKDELDWERYERDLETEELREEARIEREYQKREEEIQAKALSKERENELLEALELEKYAAINKLHEEHAKRAKALDQEVAEAKIGVVKDVFNATGEVFGEESKGAKIASIASTTIDTYDGAQRAFNSLASIPIVGVALGTVAAGAAIVSGLARVSKIAGIQTHKPKKMETGGWIGGNLHMNGGTTIEAERGEFMVNRRTMSNPQMASAVLALNAAGNSGNNGGSYQPLSEERVAQIAAQTVGAIPVNVVESDITNKQRRVQVRESKFSV